MGTNATAERRPIGVVVGEGHAMRRGLLRFVLEGEGCIVHAEATTTVQLVHALSVHRPEVVVLDDGIGATAIVVAREMLPDAKLVLVWPSDVVPIRGDARVDPTEVLEELGPAIERLCDRGESPPEVLGSVIRLPEPSDDGKRESFDHHPSGNVAVAKVLRGPGLDRRRQPPVDGDSAVDVRVLAPVLILPITSNTRPDDER